MNIRLVDVMKIPLKASFACRTNMEEKNKNPTAACTVPSDY
jgi:hypothetical protein